VYREAAVLSENRTRIAEKLKAKLTPSINLEAFYGLAIDDPILERSVTQHRGIQLTTGDSLFSRALLAITLHQATIGRSQRMRRSLIARYGTHVRFDGWIVSNYPDSATISDLSETHLGSEWWVEYRAADTKHTAEKSTKGS